MRADMASRTPLHTCTLGPVCHDGGVFEGKRKKRGKVRTLERPHDPRFCLQGSCDFVMCENFHESQLCPQAHRLVRLASSAS